MGESKHGLGWIGLGGTMAQYYITACYEASNLHAQQQGFALHSSEVIPAKAPKFVQKSV